MSEKFQAPRGTHDVLPADRLWWHVVRTIEEQCAQYGWSPIQTPGSRRRRSSSGPPAPPPTSSTRRCTRSRIGASACSRSSRGHRTDRARVRRARPRQEPQPIKAYTIAPMYRYSRPGRGRYREHWQLCSRRSARDPAIDAEVIQFYAELLRRLGVTEWSLLLNSIGDANCRPQYVAQLEEWLDGHPELANDEEVAHKRATSVLQVFDVKSERSAPRSTSRRRSATRSATTAARTSTRSRRISTRTGSRTRSTRRSSAGSTTTRGRPSSSSGRRRTPTRRSAAAAATTASSRRSAARRRQASASARGSSGSCSRSSAKGVGGRGAAPRRLRRLRGAGAARPPSPADRRLESGGPVASTPTTLAAR